MCTHFAIMCDYELLSKTQFALDLTMFIQGHSAVSTRFLLPIYMYKSLLAQCCVNKGSYYPSTCINLYCHSAVSIRFFTTPLHVQVLTATVMCQYCFLSLLYMYKSFLPQCCVNKVFLLPLYVSKSLLPQCCVNNGYYYPSICTSPYCYNAVSIRVPTTPLHVQVLTATVLCL